MNRGFWTLLEELGPRLPPGGDVVWIASLETIVRWLRSQGLEINETAVESALASASQWNPGWPWTVERHGDQFRFTQACW